MDICPPLCDEALYKNTCSLREKRLDLEEQLTEEKKVLDLLRKDRYVVCIVTGARDKMRKRQTKQSKQRDKQTNRQAGRHK